MRKYLTLIGLLLLFAACKKEKKRYVPLNADLKRNYSFKVGSYWIYKDSLSGREDSFYVTRYQYHPYVEGEKMAYDQVGVEIQQTRLSGLNIDTSTWTLVLYAGMSIYVDYYRKPHRDYFSVTSINTSYPFIDGNKWGTETVIWPQVVLNGINYSKVASCSFGTVDKKKFYDFYLKDSIGFVKINFQQDSLHYIWELQRYHINY